MFLIKDYKGLYLKTNSTYMTEESSNGLLEVKKFESHWYTAVFCEYFWMDF